MLMLGWVRGYGVSTVEEGGRRGDCLDFVRGGMLVV